MGLFDISINPLFKLYRKGDIVRLYKKMYNLAEELAIHELEQRKIHLVTSANKDDIKDEKGLYTYVGNIETILAEYKQQRIDYHVKEMQKLLIMRSKEDKELK